MENAERVAEGNVSDVEPEEEERDKLEKSQPGRSYGHDAMRKAAEKGVKTKKILSAAEVTTLVRDFRAACSKGYQPDLKASSVPKSCEHMVQGLKKAKGVDNPFAVANWAHSEGRC